MLGVLNAVWTGTRALCEQAPLLRPMAAPDLAVGASCPREGARNDMTLWYLMGLFIYMDSAKLFGSLWVLA